MDDLIYLISEDYTEDDFGQLVPSETSVPVWAHLQSVNRSEWYNAGQAGLQPQLVASTPVVNYSGETIVEIGGKRYGVYRTYFGPDTDLIELYLERKAGV